MKLFKWKYKLNANITNNTNNKMHKYSYINLHFFKNKPLTHKCFVTLTAAVQALVTTPIYERFFEDKVGQIVDLCCTCNVSLMLLTSRYHGHYVHGRTVHGKSDVGLRQMHENFAKEEVGSGSMDE